MTCWRRGVSIQVAGHRRPFSGILLGETRRRWTEAKCTLEAPPTLPFRAVQLQPSRWVKLSVHKGTRLA